jgi:two-component system, LuxR family, response regulator FixJ
MDAEWTICIVDDDDAVRDSIRAILVSAGYAVSAYASAAGLLEDPAVEGADCLLFDLNMPEMSGLELLESLRSRGVATPALFLTANGERSSARMSSAAVLKVFRKPVSDEELLQWIETACNEAG